MVSVVGGTLYLTHVLVVAPFKLKTQMNARTVAVVERSVAEILLQKQAAIKNHTEVVFDLARHYYVKNGRGAVVINYKNVHELAASNLRQLMTYMPLESATLRREHEAAELMLSYDPLTDFVLFLSVGANGATPRDAYVNVSLHHVKSFIKTHQ